MFRLSWLLLGVSIWAVLPDMSMSNPGDKKGYLYYEFRSSLSKDEVKKYFQNVTVTYSVMIYPCGHYIVVIENTQDEALKSLILPSDIRRDMRTFPMITLHDALDIYGIRIPATDLRNMSDGNLTFVEGTWEAKDLNDEQFRAFLSRYVDKMRSKVEPMNKPMVGFTPAGHLPSKIISFWKLSDSEAARIFSFHTDPIGGPGSVQWRVLKICNI